VILADSAEVVIRKTSGFEGACHSSNPNRASKRWRIKAMRFPCATMTAGRTPEERRKNAGRTPEERRKNAVGGCFLHHRDPSFHRFPARLSALEAEIRVGESLS
jgi:hypothetical protein